MAGTVLQRPDCLVPLPAVGDGISFEVVAARETQEFLHRQEEYEPGGGRLTDPMSFIACIKSLLIPLGRSFHVGGNKLIRLKSREPPSACYLVSIAPTQQRRHTVESKVIEKVLFVFDAFTLGKRVK